MSILVTLLILLLVILLIKQFVGINTPAGIICLIVVVLLVLGYHGGGHRYLF